MTFPQKLQKYRKAAKLSQEELAHRLGVSRQSVSKWEQGVSFPETEKLIELSSLMGTSVDSLLKDEDPSSTSESSGTSGSKRSWLTVLLSGLLIVTVIALVLMIWRLKAVSEVLTDYSSQQEETVNSADDLNLEAELPSEENQAADDDPAETGREEPELAPDGLGIPESGFENKYLHELQSWFFDFAREYRLDYMPYFTQDDGAPTDSKEYLYWAYAVNLDHWGENAGTMTKSYVEQTVMQYFGVTPGQHRSHRKSWDFDAETETYVAWPEGLREKPYYLLNSVEVDQDCYTIHATCYSPDYLPSEADDARLRTALLAGETTEMSPQSEITISFYLDYFSFHRPVFVAFEENFQIGMDTERE